MRVAILNHGIHLIGEGLAAGLWTDSDLVSLQGYLVKVDLLTGLLMGFRGERAAFNEILLAAIADRPHFWERKDAREDTDMGWESFPRGWLYQNLVRMNRYYDESILAAIHPAERRIHPKPLVAADRRLESSRVTLYSLFARQMTPAFLSATRSTASTQALADKALLGCALERYRLAHGEFPETLEALEPAFLPNLPRDIMSGEPYKYRTSDNGRFILYSVGWNQQDDGGAIPPSPDGKAAFEPGDWVGPY